MNILAPLWAVIAILAIVAIVAFAVWLIRRTAPGDPTAGVVSATWYLSLAFIAIGVCTTLAAAVQTMVASTINVSVPVEFWPTLPEGAKFGGFAATISNPTLSEANLDITGLSISTRILLTSGNVLNTVAVLAIAVLVAHTARGIRDGKPFGQGLARSAFIAAVVVAAAGMLGEQLAQIGVLEAARQALDWTEFSGTCGEMCSDPELLLPKSQLSYTLNFWPLMAGLVLAAFSVLVRHGSQLQDDAAGLV